MAIYRFLYLSCVENIGFIYERMHISYIATIRYIHDNIYFLYEQIHDPIYVIYVSYMIIMVHIRNLYRTYMII